MGNRYVIGARHELQGIRLRVQRLGILMDGYYSGYGLRVTGYGLRVTSYELRVTSYG